MAIYSHIPTFWIEGRTTLLLNVHRISDVRQIEIHTAETLLPVASPVEVETAIAKLRKYKLPGSDQIPTEAGGETLWRKIHKLVNSNWNKEECLISGRNLLFYQVTKMAKNLTVVSWDITAVNFIYNFIQYSYLKVKSKCRWNYWGLL
jgi:hypothetical protein